MTGSGGNGVERAGARDLACEVAGRVDCEHGVAVDRAAGCGRVEATRRRPATSRCRRLCRRPGRPAAKSGRRAARCTSTRPEPGVGSTASGQLSETEPSGFGVAVGCRATAARVVDTEIGARHIARPAPLLALARVRGAALARRPVVSSKLVVAGSRDRRQRHAVAEDLPARDGERHGRLPRQMCGTVFVGELAETCAAVVTLGGVTSTSTRATLVDVASGVGRRSPM